MTYWSAILLGIIQGLAEFLPISSSGHLAILQNFLRIGDLENQMLFDVLLHLGTLGAVILAYHTELRGLCREGLAPLTEAVVGGKRLRVAVRLGAALACLGCVAGLLLTFYLTFVDAYASLSVWNLLLFMLAWLVPTWLISGWVNQY